MKARSYEQYCALARALDVIGDRWSLLIVRNLLLGPLRWSDLVDTLPGIAKNLLSSRLATLEAAGVVAHRGDRYVLTSRGAELERPVFALADWGERHVMGPPRPNEAFRVRYLMTAVRRKLRAQEPTTVIQLVVDDDPYIIAMGPSPSVRAGEAPSDVVVRCGARDLAPLLLTQEPLKDLRDEGRVHLDGPWAPLETLRDALRAVTV